MFKKAVNVKNIKRLDEILHILFAEGFGFLLKRRILKKNPETIESDGPFRLRMLLEKLGPTFVKFGQLLSVRPDLIPMAYIKELENLQDNVKPFPYEEVNVILKQEYGKDTKSVFKNFEKIPIASASISQVHKAVLKNNKIVAVKVQRPNIKEIILTDINIMYYIARLIEKHYEPLKKYEPVKIIDEFSKWTIREIDFRNEARNSSIFYENFKNSKKVIIPKIFDELCTNKILVTEFIEGTEIRELQKLKNRKFSIQKVIKTGFESILTQVFDHGFFHADPHPGNILVTNNGRIAFLDFGIVGHFNPDLKEKSVNIFMGILNDDVDLIVETFLSMSLVQGEIDEFRFKNEIEEAIFPLQAGKIKDVHVSHVLEKVLDIALKYKVRMPIDFVLLGKTILTIEGVAMAYDPNFNIAKSAQPFIKKLMLKSLKPKRILKQGLETSIRYKDLLEKFPAKASRILDKLEKGKIEIDIEDTDIKKLTVEMGRSSNRVAYGVVIASLVIGSSITLAVSDGNPVSIIATVGYILATILGIILVISILNDK